MESQANSYSEAVHIAADRILARDVEDDRSRTQSLLELLYELAQSIPESWATCSRKLLDRRERDLDHVLTVLNRDLGTCDLSQPEGPMRYQILSSICQLIYTLKNVKAHNLTRVS